MKLCNLRQIWSVILLISAFSWSYVYAEQSGWQREKVDWLAGPGGRIKAIRYPEGKDLLHKSAADSKLFSLESAKLQASDNNVDSPPIAGFVPQIAVAVTNKRSDDFDWVAETHMSVVGDYLTDNPGEDFIVGIFDTGASFILVGYDGADRAGIFDADLLTTSVIELGGATHSSYATVSQPLGIFVDGLAAVDQNTMLLDDSNMVGQSNLAIGVGQAAGPGEPGVPTVVGTPMSVYFVTAIFNDNQISVTYDGNNYTSPDIRFYDHSDSRIPDYNDSIPLNLIPSGAYDVEYFPDLESIFDFVYQPGSPSIIGSLLQSLFFVNSVDMYDGTRSAIDKSRFMLDTGAQVSVVGTNIGSRLGLNPANPDFEVEIQDISGEITIEPGFYIDSLEIAALGEWLRFTNVPVVMLDVSSPEGGYLDGIIGMNLFTEFNLVLRGGGLLGQDPPSLEFERIPAHLAGDIAPGAGDGMVNFLDLAAIAEAWLATPTSSNWNIKANLAPRFSPDSIINFLDFAVFAENWLVTAPE
jgi:predicted aspartyl protease